MCNEGVGWKVTDDDPLEVDLYLRSNKSFGIIPSMAARFDPDEIRSRMTDEEIDLADLIREFGARLESNFWLWHRILTEREES